MKEILKEKKKKEKTWEFLKNKFIFVLVLSSFLNWQS